MLSSLSAQSESLAILDLEGRGISAIEAASLTDRLRSELVRTGQVTVVERGQMEQVLAEQDFQITGCTSNDCAVEVGQLLGVTVMLAGSIGKVGSTFSIDLRTIDVETGRIGRSLMRNYRGEIDGLLDEMGYVAADLVNLLRSEGIEAPPAAPLPPFAAIHTEPANAQVSLNGNQVGVTPVDSLELVPGQQNTLRINLAGFAPIDTSLVAQPGGQYDLAWNLVALRSWVSVASTPRGAFVTLNGRRIGRTPIRRRAITPGVRYNLALQLRNYVKVDTVFTAIPGEQTNLIIPLSRLIAAQPAPTRPTPTQPAKQPSVRAKRGGGGMFVMIAIIAAGTYYGYTEGWFGTDDGGGERPTVGPPPGVPVP